MSGPAPAPSAWDGAKDLGGAAHAGVAASGTANAATNNGPGFLGRMWDGATHLGSDAAHKLTAWNFEGRDAHNGQVPTQEEIDKDRSWRKMGPKETIYHDNNKGAPEKKFVKDDPNSFLGLGGKEAVIDGDTGKPMEAGPYQATYNYVNPAKGGISDHSPGGIARNVGHFALDVVPYWFGGTVRGDEGTTFGQRVLGPENYKKASEKWDGAKNLAGGVASKAGKGIANAWDNMTGWFGHKKPEENQQHEH